MTNTEINTALEKILNEVRTSSDSGSSLITRKDLIVKAQAAGLEEKNTYRVLKPSARSTHRGYYDADKMLNILNPGVTMRIENLEVVSTGETSKVEKEPQIEKSEKFSGTYDYDAVPYTEEDIAEELSLMGTHL